MRTRSRRGRKPHGSAPFGSLLAALGCLVLVACDANDTTGTSATSGDTNPKETFTEEERALLRSLSPEVLPVPADVTNRYADRDDAAALGQKLFYDPAFSGELWDGDNNLPNSGALGKVGDTGKVACAGCHTPTGAFGDDRSLGNSRHAVSLGAGWTLRKSPSLLDVAQAKLLMWDGSKDSLFSQVFGPIEARNEMNSSRLFVAQAIFARYRDEFEAVFDELPPLDDAARFPPLTNATTGCQKTGTGPDDFVCHGIPGDGAEFDGMTPEDQDAVTGVVVDMGKAIGAYERRLACGKGRFDAWVHGQEDAMTQQEQRGAKVFLGKGRCIGCHAGPYFSDQAFHNVGMKAEPVVVVVLDADDPGAAVGFEKVLADPLNSKSTWSDGDDGRLPGTVGRDMLGAFKTPTLRCVAQRPSFMHTGQLSTLEDVVEFFARGGDPYGYPGRSEIEELALTEEDKRDLVAFLRALDGPGPEAALLD
jgi:cytochrome c peroxidase